jgi:hypothetical protein
MAKLVCTPLPRLTLEPGKPQPIGPATPCNQLTATVSDTIEGKVRIRHSGQTIAELGKTDSWGPETTGDDNNVDPSEYTAEADKHTTYASLIVVAWVSE